MNPLFSRILSKLRRIRFSRAPRSKLLTFGAVYLGTYTNFKHDRTPLIWVQWSDETYTHGINIHYLNQGDRMWFMRTIYLMAKGGQRITPRNMYNFLKMRKPSIVKVAYRKYFTSLLNMRLVSPGITPLHKLVYTDHNEQFIKLLNKQLEPSEMRTGATRIAFSDTELQERVVQATQATPLTQRRVAPYIRKDTQKAPWLKG